MVCGHVNSHCSIRMVLFMELVWRRSVEVRCGASPFSISRIVRAEKEEDSEAVCCIFSDGMSNKLCDLQHEPKFLTGGFNSKLDYECLVPFEYFKTFTCI